MFDDEATLTFPGDQLLSRRSSATRGRAAPPTPPTGAGPRSSAFLQRYVAAGIQMEVEDILVNGAPWKARAMVRVHVWSPGPDGEDRYANRAVLAVQTRWGKIVEQEDYEDTERAEAFDRPARPRPSPRPRSPSDHPTRTCPCGAASGALVGQVADRVSFLSLWRGESARWWDRFELSGVISARRARPAGR